MTLINRGYKGLFPNSKECWLTYVVFQTYEKLLTWLNNLNLEREQAVSRNRRLNQGKCKQNYKFIHLSHNKEKKWKNKSTPGKTLIENNHMKMFKKHNSK